MPCFFKLNGIALGRLAIGLAGFAALPVWSQPSAVLTGFEVARNSEYAYLGVVLPLSGGDREQGWMQRYWLDYLTYRYEQTPSRDIDAEVVGGEAALGYQKGSEAGWWGVYLGARYADTRLDPDDLNHDGRGGNWYAKLQLNGEMALGGGWRLGGIVSHLVDHDSFWARLRLQTAIARGWHVGPEFTAQGDPNYRAYKLGAFVGNIRVGADSALTFKAGASKPEDDSASPYAGAELYIPF